MPVSTSVRHLGELTVGFVLLLEDEPLIALDVEQVLSDAGFQEIRIISSCCDAEAWLQQSNPVFAIIDPRLRDGMCDPIARILVKRNIPFIVYSGDVITVADQEPAFAAGVWLSKPSPPTDLIEAIETAVLGRV